MLHVLLLVGICQVVAMITWFSNMSEHVLESCRIVYEGCGSNELIVIRETPSL